MGQRKLDKVLHLIFFLLDWLIPLDSEEKFWRETLLLFSNDPPLSVVHNKSISKEKWLRSDNCGNVAFDEYQKVQWCMIS